MKVSSRMSVAYHHECTFVPLPIKYENTRITNRHRMGKDILNRQKCACITTDNTHSVCHLRKRNHINKTKWITTNMNDSAHRLVKKRLSANR